MKVHIYTCSLAISICQEHPITDKIVPQYIQSSLNLECFTQSLKISKVEILRPPHILHSYPCFLTLQLISLLIDHVPKPDDNRERTKKD